ncbi:Uncharacterised protein [Candidatus Norongarragalina meridionalis]|nr:Uncharacterised protein [Candidatus Norongarragalina meridionalis]
MGKPVIAEVEFHSALADLNHKESVVRMRAIRSLQEQIRALEKAQHPDLDASVMRSIALLDKSVISAPDAESRMAAAKFRMELYNRYRDIIDSATRQH